jgi:hypothetical protein
VQQRLSLADIDLVERAMSDFSDDSFALQNK